MIHKDYIVRIVQQMTQALAQVLFRKKYGQYDEALGEIQQAGRLFLGLDLNAVKVISYDDLRQALRVKKAEDAEHVSILAELLRHQGDCFDFEGDPDAAHRSYALALDLYLDLRTANTSTQLVDLADRIDLLLEHLDPFSLDPGTQRKLFGYLEDARRYADAEDLLFHLADEHPTSQLYDEGIAFFDRLLKTSYRYLKAGNLPYEEVKEGRAAFQQKMASVRNL